MGHSWKGRWRHHPVGALAVLALVAVGCSSSSNSPTTSDDESSQPAAPCVLQPDTRVTDLTLEELRQFELNNGDPIPTLEEYLDLANAAGVGVLPEIKTFLPPGATEPEPPTPGQLDDVARMVGERTNLSQVLIGSFDERVLAYFATARPEWPRIWFRGLGGQDPIKPPTVPELRERAPSAGALGVLSILYGQGTSPLDGEVYNVPADFSAAGIPVYIWFNVLVGGDAPEGGEGKLGYDVAPGWSSLVDLDPPNITWIATDNTAAYAEWAAAQAAAGRPAPAMVAHRGGGTEGVSENSLEAFRQAVADGADVLETDIQWTRPTPDAPNGVPVIMHDATINRTTRCAD